jgi:putative component of membrane protein insertase Oxa1/YidC/SpoIIIJ protein YidD
MKILMCALKKSLEIFIDSLFFFYQYLISPALQILFQVNCRFEESCSKYSKRMIKAHGFLVGIKMSFFRILKCSQWSCQSHLE